jgi:hypothetical protein
VFLQQLPEKNQNPPTFPLFQMEQGTECRVVG